MATTTKKPVKKETKKDHWSEAAVKTEVPEIVISDEFHIDLQENKSMSNENTRRVIIAISMAVGLALLGVLWLWLTHDSV